MKDKKINSLSKKRILEILKGILTFGIFYFSSYLQIIPIMLFNIDTNNYTINDLAIINTFTDILLVIVLVIIYFKDLKEMFKRFKKSYKTDLDTGLKYWIIGLIIMCASNILIGMLTYTAYSLQGTCCHSWQSEYCPTPDRGHCGVR